MFYLYFEHPPKNGTNQKNVAIFLETYFTSIKIIIVTTAINLHFVSMATGVRVLNTATVP